MEVLKVLKVDFLAYRLSYEELQNCCIDSMTLRLGRRRIQVVKTAFVKNSMPDQLLLRLVLQATAYDIANTEGGWRAWRESM